MSDALPSSADADLEKRLETIAAKELRIAKREKELTAKQTELDRKLRAAEEQEEKLGSVGHRETTLELGNQQLQQAQKELKRREKAVKDQEASSAEREARCVERESQLEALKQKLQGREDDLNQREDRMKADLAEAQRLNIEAQERCKRLAEDEKQLQQRQEELHNAERTVRRREQNVMEDEAEGTKRKKELREREDAVDKLNQQLQARQTTLMSRELQNQTERDRITKLSKQLSEEEKSREKDIAALAARRDDVQKLQIASEEARHIALREQEEAAVKIADAERKLAELDKQTTENIQFQKDLSNTKAELSQFDSDLKKRERRLLADVRDLEYREQMFARKKTEFENNEATLRANQEDLAQRRAQLRQDETMFTELKAQHEKDFTALAQLEESLKRKSQGLNRREEELLNWMKEMQWREMMLGDREQEIDREPYPLLVQQGMPGGANASASNANSGGGSPTPNKDGLKVGSLTSPGNRRRSSVAPPKWMSNTAASSRDGGAVSDEEDRNAYSKALIDLQLRRLKDQYVSAQLKWGTLEATSVVAAAVDGTNNNSTVSQGTAVVKHHRVGSTGKQQSPTSQARKSRSRSKSGLPTMYDARRQDDLDTDLARVSFLESRRAEVHSLSTSFLRSVAKIRGFDLHGEPSATAAREMDFFSEHERSLIAFAINFEYLTKHLETALSTLLKTCPLDSKEKALDARDLLMKTSSWWAAERTEIETRLSVLLDDRRRYLDAASATLSSKGLGASGQQVRGSGGGGGSESDAPQPLRRVSTSSPMRCDVALPSSTQGHVPFRLDSNRSSFRLEQQLSVEASPAHGFGGGGGSSILNTLSSTPVVDHIRQSPILGPRSDAVLRACRLAEIQMDAAAGSGENPAKRRMSSASPTPLPISSKPPQHPSSPTTSTAPGGGGFDPRHYDEGTCKVSIPTSTSDSPTTPVGTTAGCNRGGTKGFIGKQQADNSNSDGDDEEAISVTYSRPGTAELAHATNRVLPHPNTLPPRPSTSQSACGGARGDFNTLTDEAMYCLMRTGRTQSANTQKHPQRRSKGKKGESASPSSPPRSHKAAPMNTPLHTFVPPSSWTYTEHPVNMPKILQMAAMTPPRVPSTSYVAATGSAATPPPPFGDTTTPHDGTSSDVFGIVKQLPEDDALLLSHHLRHHQHNAKSPYLAPVVKHHHSSSTS